MRSLNKNKRRIYYANRLAETPLYDEYGNETGESVPNYGPAKPLDCNVSAASGEEAVQAFGSFTGYTRTICVSDTDCPMNENTIVWFGVNPPKPHNYVITKVADSKNSVIYALQEVSVT